MRQPDCGQAMPLQARTGDRWAPLRRRVDALWRLIGGAMAQAHLTPQPQPLPPLDRLMRDIVEQSGDGILCLAADGRVALANDAALRLFGWRREALLGQPVQALLTFADGPAATAPAAPGALSAPAALGALGGEAGGERREATARRRDGTTFLAELSVRTALLGPLPGPGSGVESGPESDAASGLASGPCPGPECWQVLVVRDVTARKAQEQRLRHLALHDGLTGLPNRILLKDRLDHGLKAAAREGRPLALLLLDLDRFKEVNDTLGHAIGDLLLIDLAGRLQACLRASDTVARLAGDEFAVLLPAAASGAQAWQIARRIVAAVRQPFAIGPDLRLEIGISIGIALYPDHAESASRLLQCADIAMYAAKRGAAPIAPYDRAADQGDVRRRTLSGGLRQAIEEGQLLLVYQPKLDLQRAVIASFEALARWRHPALGSIAPGEFLPLAEQTGMLRPFTRWSCDAALAQLAAWERGGQRVGLALNLSARAVHDQALVGELARLLERWQVDPGRLTLEMTECALMLDPGGVRDNLRRLAALGLRLAIDDFGTGYSSLSHLQRLPLDEIKIDKSFVVNMTRSEPDLAIVRAIIDLAHNLGLAVVAEGIESARHVDLLRGLGCDLGQGFHIARPQAATALAAWGRSAPWPIGAAGPARGERSS